ncbi:MAG: response regulator [Chloroflexi bacterium]|nr:response regulator [Chloroflexota bacterium]
MASGRRRQLRALIVEDDEAVAGVMADALASGGFQVVVASNGAEAVRLAQAAPPDVVLLDLGLPELSGHSVLHELREAEPTCRVPVMVVTGLPHLLPAEDRALIQTLVQKPFDVPSLVRAARWAVHQQPQATIGTPPVPPGEL